MRKETEDFKEEEDLTHVPVYREMTLRYQASVEYTDHKSAFRQKGSLTSVRSGLLDQSLGAQQIATDQKNNIEGRWRMLRQSFELDEHQIIKAFEEIMIKNQLLTVSFDDLCAEKNKRKNYYDQLETEMLGLKEQEKEF